MKFISFECMVLIVFFVQDDDMSHLKLFFPSLIFLIHDDKNHTSFIANCSCKPFKHMSRVRERAIGTNNSVSIYSH